MIAEFGFTSPYMGSTSPAIQRLKTLLVEKGISSITQAADDLKVSHTTIPNWIRNKALTGNKSSREKALALAERLGFATFSQLVAFCYGEPPPREDLRFIGTAVPEPEIDLPLWPSLPADENWGDIEVVENFDVFPVPMVLARPNRNSPERIVARIVGTSMEPRLIEGDYVVVEMSRARRPGRMVLAKKDGARTLKLLYEKPRGDELVSINRKHGSAHADEWEVEGYVVGIIHNYGQSFGSIQWDDGGLGA